MSMSKAVLDDAAINEADIIRGRYNEARVEVFAVNWQDTAQRVIMICGNLGEINRGDLGFTAEVRGVAAKLNQPVGRLYQYTCDADLGDARCQVDIAADAYTSTGAITGLDPDNDKVLRVATGALNAARADGFFDRGLIIWTSGERQGQSSEVKTFRRDGGDYEITLWREPIDPLAVFDTFTIAAGCDKRLATCRDKFNNVINHRGHPFMPGNDSIIQVPLRGDSHDGGKLTKD